LKADQEQRTAYFRELVNSGSAHCGESDQFEGGATTKRLVEARNFYNAIALGAKP